MTLSFQIESPSVGRGVPLSDLRKDERAVKAQGSEYES
jgi:hypothetical protein